MKVKELIDKLKEYNPEATVSMSTFDGLKSFSISFGGKTPTRKTCEKIVFYVPTKFDHYCYGKKPKETHE